METFALRVQKLRQRRGMSRRVLSELCGLSKNTIARYERGERRPGLQEAVALADYFEVSLDWLCGRDFP